MSLVNYSPDPLFPAKDQIKKFVDVTTDTVLADFLKPIDLTVDAPVRIYVNNTEVKKADWSTFKPAINDIITIKTDVHGDNVVPLILTLALIIVAPELGAFAATSAGFAATGTAATIATGVITVAGGLLINMLFAPSVPGINDGGGVSPTYALQGGRNTIRQDEPIPIVIGKTKITPDLAAKPYTQFRGEDQWLYISYNFGLTTDVTISDIKIGKNSIDDYNDMDYFLSPGNTGELQQIPGNVDEDAGAALERPGGVDTPITRTTSTDTVAIEIDLEGSIYQFNSKGKIRNYAVYVNIEYREVGSPTWLPFVEPDPVSPLPDEEVVIINSSTKPYRNTFRREVSSGQYEVRLTRKSNDDTGSTERFSVLNWTKLRSFQTDTADYTGQKRLGIIVRASGQLQGYIDNLTAVASGECEAWNGSSWVLTENQNPAWWFRYIAKGRFNPTSGLREFGGGLSDSDLDLDAIKAWGAYCDSKGLRIGYVFDSSMVTADALNLIARVGRASLNFSSGKMGVVVDEEDLPVTACIGEPDMLADTFDVSFVSEAKAEKIIVEFNNEDNDYIVDTVSATVPGVGSPTLPVTVRIPGLINKDQAGKEALLSAALNYYRRKIVVFELDYTGYNIQRGDVIAVSNSSYGWGYSGRLRNDGTNNTTTLTLDQEVPFVDGAGGTYYIRVRHPDGTIENVPVQYSATDTNVITLLTPLSQDPSAYANNDPQDLVYQFDSSNFPGVRLKVMAITPTGDNLSQVRLTCIIDDPDYYDAETGSFDYDTIISSFNQTVASVSNLQVNEELLNPEGPIKIHISWDMENARGARVSIKNYPNGSDDITQARFDDYGDIQGRYFEFQMQDPGTITVRLTALPFDPAKQSATTIEDTFYIQGIFLNDSVIPKLPAVSGLELQNVDEASGNSTSFYGRDAKFTWRQIESGVPEIGNEETNIGTDYGSFQDSVFRDYEITILDPDTGDVRRKEYVLDNHYVYTYEKNKEDSEILGIPTDPALRTFVINVRQRGRQNQLSASSSLTVTNPPPEEPSAVTLDSGIGFISINLQQPDLDTDYEGILVWMDTSSGFTPSGEEKGDGNCVYRGKANNFVLGGLTSSTAYYLRIAGYDTFSRDPGQLNLTSEVSQSTSADPSAAAVQRTSFDGIIFTANDPSTNDVSWTAGTAIWNDGGTVTTYPISAGNASWTAGDLYIYYHKGDATLSTTTTPSVAAGTDSVILKTYHGGLDLRGSGGDAYLDGSLIYGQTILGNKIIAGDISSTELGANSVIAGKVAADAITGNEILAGSITAGDAVFQAAAIQTADLANALITNAKVGNAAIDTLQVAGGAIIAPGASYNAAGYYTPLPNTWYELARVTVNLPIINGIQPVAQIFYSCVPYLEYRKATARVSSGPVCYPVFRILRNGTSLFEVDNLAGASFSDGAPANGNNTYVLQVKMVTGVNTYYNYNGNTNVSKRSISVFGAKR